VEALVEALFLLEVGLMCIFMWILALAELLILLFNLASGISEITFISAFDFVFIIGNYSSY
jgi:hypothetical protein